MAVEEDKHFRATEEYLKTLLQAQPGADSIVDPAAPKQPLQIEKITLNGSGAPMLSSGSFAESIYHHGDREQRFDAVVDINSDLRAMSDQQITKTFLNVMQQAFSNVQLEKSGNKLDAYYNFEGKPAEEAKSTQAQLDDLKKLVTDGVKEAEGKGLSPEIAALLLKENNYNEKTTSVFGYSQSTPVVSDQGAVIVNFNVKNEGEVAGGKSNSATVVENIEARKDDIIKAVVDKAVGARIAAGASEADVASLKNDLANLTLQATASGRDDWKEVVVRFGKPIEPDAFGVKVGESPLKTFETKDLAKIVTDSILFAGTDANKVDHLIAGSGDLRRIIEENKALAPENFGKALEAPILKESLPWRVSEELDQKKQETQKVEPIISIQRSVDTVPGQVSQLSNKVHILFDLPKDVTLAEVVRQIGRQAGVAGDKSTQPSAATFGGFGQTVAAGAGAVVAEEGANTLFNAADTPTSYAGAATNSSFAQKVPPAKPNHTDLAKKPEGTLSLSA